MEPPPIEVDYLEPLIVGTLLGPDGAVLLEVREQRPPFGFQPQPKE